MSHPSSGSLSLCYAASVFSSRSPAVTGRGGMGQDRALEHASDRHRCGWTMRRTPMALPLDWPKTERSEVPLSGPDTSVEHGSSQDTRKGHNLMLCRGYTRRLRMQVLYSQITDPRGCTCKFNEDRIISTSSRASCLERLGMLQQGRGDAVEV